MKICLPVMGLAVALAASANAAIVSTTIHDHGALGVHGAPQSSIVSGDLLEMPGVIGTDSASPTTWHGAAAGRFSQLTDGLPPTNGLDGLLNDFQGPTIGVGANQLDYFTYSFPSPQEVGRINIIGGNFGGDARIFLTFLAEYSTDNGANWQGIGGPGGTGYYQSDPTPSINVLGNPVNISGDPNNPYEETMVSIFDDASATLISAVTDVRFLFFNVGNTQGQYQDPYDGLNPFNGLNDNLNTPVQGSLVWEIDVIEVPEPATLALLGMGALAVIRRRR